MMGDKTITVSDIEQVNELFDILDDRLPSILQTLKEVLYSEEAGRQLGKAVGAFYNELLASGIEQAAALEMTRDYMGGMKQTLKNTTIQKSSN